MTTALDDLRRELTRQMPAGIYLVPHHEGFNVYDRNRPKGWIFEQTDGRWVADRSNGDYLDGDFESAAAAIAALLGSRA